MLDALKQKDEVLLTVLPFEVRQLAKCRLHKGWSYSHIFSDIKTSSMGELRAAKGEERLWAEYLTPVNCGQKIVIEVGGSSIFKNAPYVKLDDEDAITDLCAKFGMTTQGPQSNTLKYSRAIQILSRGHTGSYNIIVSQPSYNVIYAIFLIYKYIYSTEILNEISITLNSRIVIVVCVYSFFIFLRRESRR